MKAVLVLALAAIALGSGDAIATAAEKMVGKYPYSSGGGDDNGPTYGGSYAGCDDTKVLGFDCTGLTKYSVFQGTGKSIPHPPQAQYDSTLGKKVKIADIQRGDILYYGTGGSTSAVYHGVIYIGNNSMVEAQGHDDYCKGIPMRLTSLRKNNLCPYGNRFW